jgi:hypothetical protein
VTAAIYIPNHVPTKANREDERPLPCLHSSLGLPYFNDTKHFHAYSAAAYVHIPPENCKKGKKFMAWACQGYLVGYANGLTTEFGFLKLTRFLSWHMFVLMSMFTNPTFLMFV